MLLERLAIENYGAYRGRSEFVLSATDEKPIVLIGGLNGAGKTTIFESLMIALYGRNYIGRRATRREYTDFLSKKMHRHDGVQADTASVGVSFRFYHNGHDDMYDVSRNWSRDGSSITERLMIRKNGEPMDDVDESKWQSFLEGLLPLGIARLFFFDGEKMVRMTKWDASGNAEMKASLDTLLGTEIINRLRSDLDLYTVRNSGRDAATANKAIMKEYEDLIKEKDSIASELEVLTMEAERKNAEIKDLGMQIGVKESKISGIGGGYADIRGKLLTQRAVLLEKMRQQTKSIHDEFGEDAPLYMMTSLLGRMTDRIEEDMRIMQQRMSATMVQSGLDKIKKEMSSDTFWPAGTDGPALSRTISDKLDEIFAGKDVDRDVFFDMTSGDASHMLEKISRLRDGRKSILTKLEEHGRTSKVLDRIESDLAKVPRDDELGPRISEINSLHQDVGMLRSEVGHIEQQISSKHAYQKILKNKLGKLIESVHKNEMSDTSIQLASKIKDVLETYRARVKEYKMCELESNLLDALNVLMHKKHIQGIRVDRDTFQISMHEGGDGTSPGNPKSMGERQMIGTALLWAIAKTSGRSLPFVIDTPLGRLDGKHLSNLTERFYPFASHQIILLSTDREIGPKEYGRLSQHISRSYKITCSEEKSVTTVSDGYFTDEVEVVAEA